MRPIRLTIAGINSFEEEQVIDFEKLMSGGLFGIFGVTGSGKSTILDAITLALYGKIVRASKEYINKNCQKAHISFTFSLKENEKKYFCVTRRFKNKNGNANADKASLVEMQGENEIVLADMTTECNRKIEEMIGLTFEDFIRTVVLPQGKFSEFLTLEGAQRNAMLERLFHLEEYGDALNAKVKARMAVVDAKLNECIGALGQYEEVSEQLLEQKIKEEKEAETALKENKKDYQLVVKEYETAKAQIEQQNKLLAFQKEQQQLLDQNDTIKEIEQRMELAKKAQQLLPQVAKYDEIKNSLEQYEKTIKQLTSEKEKLQTLWEEAEKQQKASIEKKETMMPQLEQKSHILNEVEKEMQSVKTTKAQLAELTQTISELKNDAQRLEQLRAEQEVNIQKQKETIKQTEAEMLTERVSFEYQKLISNAIATEEKYHLLEGLSVKDGEICPVCGNIYHAAEHGASGKAVELIQLEEQLAEYRQQTKITDFLKEQKNIERDIKKNEKLQKKLKTLREELETAEYELRAQGNVEALELVKKKESEAKGQQKAQQQSVEERVKQMLPKLEILLDEVLDQKDAQQLEILMEQLDLSALCSQIDDQKGQLAQAVKQSEEKAQEAQERLLKCQKEESEQIGRGTEIETREKIEKQQLEESIAEYGFLNIQDVRENQMSQELYVQKEEQVKKYYEKLRQLEHDILRLKEEQKEMQDSENDFEQLTERKEQLETANEQMTKTIGILQGEINKLKADLIKVKELNQTKEQLEHQRSICNELKKLFEGRKFVEFVARERLQYVTGQASVQLSSITNGNYTLELAAEKGEFCVRDYKNGGMPRSIKSLSGGELFLVSLSLALALSTEIQLKGKAPLEFFFLDEGFGTLDEDLLDVVMSSLESLQSINRTIGIISHVETIKARVPVKLLVTPAMAGMHGTLVQIEKN